MNPPIPISPGDHLLYGNRGDVFGFLTSVKTWSSAVHIEVYAGDENSYASRNGIGVNLYPYRDENLIAVLRPGLWDPIAARAYFDTVQGQRYDWVGLLCFTLAVKQGSPNKMFCSEFATRLDRAAGCLSFAPGFDADRVAPGSFFMSPAFSWAWVKPGITP